MALEQIEPGQLLTLILLLGFMIAVVVFCGGDAPLDHKGIELLYPPPDPPPGYLPDGSKDPDWKEPDVN